MKKLLFIACLSLTFTSSVIAQQCTQNYCDWRLNYCNSFADNASERRVCADEWYACRNNGACDAV